MKTMQLGEADCERYRTQPDIFESVAKSEGATLLDTDGNVLYEPPRKKIDALDRGLRANGEHSNYDKDAARIHEVVRRYWGDEAVTVLERALVIAKAEAAK